MFWPGSEAAIGGLSPTRWWPFDGGLPNAERVGRVLDWLSLPEGERPNFVSLYFQEVDHIGHVNGPDSPEAHETAVRTDKLFDKFFRSDDPRVQAETGSGLGLSLAREVVRMHGGEITVESVLNQGSTFTVLLPVS